MERFFRLIFSMKWVALGLFLFLTSIGVATFIESMHGVQASKIAIYNAGWFTALLLYLSLAMMYNIYSYRMWQREKMALLCFHVAFLIIMIGAAITRYRGFEGQLVAREGESVDYIYTADPKLLVSIRDNEKTTVEGFTTWLSDWTWINNWFSHKIQHGEKSVSIDYKDFISNAIDTFEFDSKTKDAVLDVVVGQMKSNYLEYGDKLLSGSLPISYLQENNEGVSFKLSEGKIFLKSVVPLRMLPMTRMMEARQTGMPIPDSAYVSIPTNEWVPANIKTLYQSGPDQFVLKNVFYHAKKKLKKAAIKNQGLDYLTVLVRCGNDQKTVRLKGGQNNIPVPEYFSLNGLYIQLEYGAVKRSIPFNVICDAFELKKYPGSDAPSSFESYIRIEDPKNNYRSKRHIFMNHVTDYSGYRFFQSSYELDNPSTPENEEGTKLSVNHDAWGTNITYLGYLLMSIGMILSIFAPKSRFRGLNDALSKLKKKSLTIVVLSLGFNSFAQEDPSKIFHVISEEHAEALASLLVQDQSGRIMPMHTLSDQLLRKIYGANRYKEYNAVQTVLSWHMYGRYWMKQPIILVPSAVRARLKLKKYCSLEELTTADNRYKFEKEYATAHGKAEKFQDEFEKKLIKLTERFQVFQGAISWQFLTIIPKKNDKNNRWYVPMSMEIQGEDTISNLVALKYFYSLVEASKNQDYTNSNSLLGNLKLIQRTISKSIVPSESKVAYEIRYNKLSIFKTVYQGYISLGLLLLILYILGLFGSDSMNRKKVLHFIKVVLISLSAMLFLYHGTGLGFRWFISGHAPWSNGYEAIVFIAWVTVLAGGLFMRKVEVALSVALILASMMLFVSELNLLDPEISPLVPVLKSYWLMIHVAIITSSYAFLGLSFILGLLNLCFYLFQHPKRGEKLSNHIQQITAVNEMTMTVGIFMLTIGTFLGGVWANESWGRYWGWDPKETWALVSILVYAIILHLRFIPGMKSPFTFNLWSFWGYSAILFTYFGVNFMLVGLHSYAQGDGLGSFPSWLIYTIIFFLILSILSYLKYRKSNISV
jgi:cytochrome c-type biogenesis protein CcsB